MAEDASPELQQGELPYYAMRDGTDEWYTPPSIFEALGLTFDLDAASPLEGPVPWVPARRFLTPYDNGLMAPWYPDELVFLNPPYGDELGGWMNRFALHANGIALVFNRTDTRWFHAHASYADAICFIEGRLRFHGKDLKPHAFNSPAPSMLIAFGAVSVEAIVRAKLGVVMTALRRE